MTEKIFKVRQVMWCYVSGCEDEAEARDVARQSYKNWEDWDVEETLEIEEVFQQ